MKSYLYEQLDVVPILFQVEDLVPSIPGVNVSCDPPDLDVTLQVPLNSEEETQYSWNLRIHYEVRLRKSGAK